MSWGLQARYEMTFQPELTLEIVAAYAHRRFDFSDQARWVYDWLGQRVRERPIAGEIGNRPIAATSTYEDAFARAVLHWGLAPGQALELAVTPRYSTSPGADSEALTAAPEGSVFTLVSGISHELTLFEGLLTNSAFVKDYLFHSSDDQARPSGPVRLSATNWSPTARARLVPQSHGPALTMTRQVDLERGAFSELAVQLYAAGILRDDAVDSG